MLVGAVRTSEAGMDGAQVEAEVKCVTPLFEQVGVGEAAGGRSLANNLSISDPVPFMAAIRD
jgi:hypothetical protein